MVGLNADGVIQGVYIINQTETPGIGDKVANNESDYLDQFVGNKQGEISADTVAGATKTSKGLIAGCEKAAELFAKLKGEVLGA
nr:FMN-binding protein [Fumia xinanensis]